MPELAHVAKELGTDLTKNELVAVFNLLDVDKDGKIGIEVSDRESEGERGGGREGETERRREGDGERERERRRDEKMTQTT